MCDTSKRLQDALYESVSAAAEAGDSDESDDGESSEELVIWLVGGEEDDVDAFLDAIEQPDE